ncbi:uncharacterized protein MONOS_8940 [Monocercomonoides exilis]|uniref:uncharacterized protein n=1 Tax=Monocercomonoides exilis TaxID=2049356 RepID=UPI003559A36C|nr:hypothetical protein MONOS_8940 [Monocercomonoides exilis]|eukprot:MONOS_8940.1-p1 / transcript=MONOS_8940.1 / gene=MONOS_8940 / organism=Monocercomonoides_exilis_PA203 / gene_product=unspecified product / transcript_product=unspecified product / location=Mono_scaffold00352:27844-33954(+) / protein_length=2037 / sequence_SO=supercontig / SO=protein_coding / is_pseudo=false
MSFNEIDMFITGHNLKGDHSQLLNAGIVSGSSMFTVTSCTLEVTNVEIVHCSNGFGRTLVTGDDQGVIILKRVQIGSLKESAQTAIEESPFFAAYGQIQFFECCITGLRLNRVALFEGATNVLLEDTEISNIIRKEGNGAIFDPTIGEMEIWELNNISLKNCQCENGNGGAIFVRMEKGGLMHVGNVQNVEMRECKVSIEEEAKRKGGGIFIDICDDQSGFELNNVLFEGCEAWKGKKLFLKTSNLKRIVNEVSIGWTMTDAEKIKLDDLNGFEGDTTGEEYEIPLVVYLWNNISETVHINGIGGFDFSGCGYEEAPCASIDWAIGIWCNPSPSNEWKFLMETEVDINNAICLSISSTDAALRVIGKQELTSISMENAIGVDQQTSIIYSNIELTFEKTFFQLPNVMKEGINQLFWSSSNLELTNCMFELKEGTTIGYSLIEIEGGSLEGTCVIFGSELFETVVETGCSLISVSGRMKLEEWNFFSCVQKDGNGSCIDLKRVSQIDGASMKNCSFCDCESRGVNRVGGAMAIEVEGDGWLSVENCTFFECKIGQGVEDNKGLGGGFYVECAGGRSGIRLVDLQFQGCQAWRGKNMFVSGWNLSEIVNKEHFKWEMSEGELGSLDELCGWERKTTGEEYVIPLVVYLWTNWSGNGFVSNENEGDFSGCGYLEAPCSSIDHLISLRYGSLEEGETHIKIVGSGLLQKSTSLLSSSLITPIVSVEGEREGTGLKVKEGGINEDEEGVGMISSNIIVSFSNISFSLPNELASHSSLIHSTSSSATLSIKRCSFVCEDSAKETKYCLIKADGGKVVIEDCTFSNFRLVKGFIEFTTDVKSVDVVNVSISNTTISGCSLISLSQSSLTNMLIEKAKENTEQRIRVNDSSFTNITCLENRACMMNVGSFSSGMECVVEGCVLTKCMSERSEEGGGMKICMKREESVVKVSGCSFGMCVCSIGNGRGGGLMIDALDPNVECFNTEIQPLELRLEYIRFMMNDAFVGKDAFIRCNSIELQLNERLFGLDFSQEALKGENSIYGSDKERDDVDLIPLITFYYSSQVFVCVNGSDSRQCGAQNKPCKSLNNAVDHIEQGVMNAILIDGEGTVTKECVIGDLNVNSYKKSQAIVKLKSDIAKSAEKDCIMEFINESAVERCSFEFEDTLQTTHSFILKVKNGSTEIHKCEFYSSATAVEMRLNSSVVSVESGELKISETKFKDLESAGSVLLFNKESNVIIDETRMSNINCEGDIVSVGRNAKVVMKIMTIENVTVLSEGCAIGMEDAEQDMSVLNCTFGKCRNSVDKGCMMRVSRCKDVKVEICVFDGEKEEKEAETVNEGNKGKEELCEWSGSLIDIENSNVEMKETTVMKSKNGGLWVSGGSLMIENSKFENNNPSVEGYPSARRNVICTGNSKMNVASVKGGDGLKDNSSLWILDEGCQLGGIASERGSSFFIPVLEGVKNISQPNGNVELMIHGKLLLPCDLSVKMSMKNGDEEEIVRKQIDEEGFISENEISTIISCSELEKVREETEVRVCIVFGKADSPSSTESFIIKNKSEPKVNGDERIVEERKEGKSYWLLIVIIMGIMLLIFLIVSVVLIVRWRKAKEEAKKYKEIVNDNIRKDPKAFEMVTMEMSPEEQWRRAEREAEKKNEERFKKRVYENSLGHSESSEHLLCESGSTEYILGKDSDKIPEWALERVDEKEEEETRKRTPSPSISSISSTSTTDSDSTFVRSESLCPTTSSMSNLVDAMACSSPHEKLIVDLRDSLFMLLHGRNEKKEMAIGSLKEREQTAAQILFWVANLALHSFDEMENGLSSLVNLSPHIVLFSEHMVICIALHSDCSSSSDDSDSSSISSSTVVTSASDGDDDDDRDSLPSSAFEDADDNWKECLRWKAPELQMSKKMGATKESVEFSIGMMLWECLALQIPFGEYPAEVAGQKIANGERPNMEGINTESELIDVAKRATSMNWQERPTLGELKREFIQRFPAGAAILTMSDAIDLNRNRDRRERNRDSGSCGDSDCRGGSLEETDSLLGVIAICSEKL